MRGAKWIEVVMFLLTPLVGVVLLDLRLNGPGWATLAGAPVVVVWVQGILALALDRSKPAPRPVLEGSRTTAERLAREGRELVEAHRRNGTR